MTRTTPAGRSDATAGQPDGRSTRWEQHRVTRRAELVEHALRAIRRHGARVGMDEIAAEAGTSKTVVYRHFTDKAGLYRAVVERVNGLILHDLTGAVEEDREAAADPRRMMAAVVDSYLRLVERDPEVYRFVVARPLLDRPVPDDPVASMSDHIATHLTGLLAGQLRAHDQDTTPAETWGHGLVGLIRAVTDHWLATPDRMPRDRLVACVTDLTCGGLSSALRPPEDPGHDTDTGPGHDTEHTMEHQ